MSNVRINLSEVTFTRLDLDTKRAAIIEAGRLTQVEGKRITLSDLLRRALLEYLSKSERS